ncbi:hypothetical protein PRIPAC_73172 [Pristionchus pacificus]|uniref:BTB domain-containing protein n=1 Tax=Pristionchus pacificus TaxID=54126 RepID=A0A2A6C008_PRIPA|nr:hypothetical protein PRIPAC_73172 [Pristionchus pacificus]|eukprot:PDM71515.1 BTB domain-containing protein [Pristionchus pacificus]
MVKLSCLNFKAFYQFSLRMSEADETSALRAQIKTLQNDLNDVRAENSLLKMKVHANEPLTQPQPLHTREMKVEFKTGITEMRSTAHNADGVEISVKLEKIVKITRDSAYERNLKFAVTLYVKNLDPGMKKFALTTMEVKERERYSHDHRRLTTLMKPATQRFVLCSSGEAEEAGHKKTFLSQQSESASTVEFVVVVTLAVQSIASMDLDDGSTTAVIVKGKEFSVSAQYLSLWSAYFRAYFNADMKEKKTGKYPIKDKDITPEDFEELLMLTRRVELFLIDFERNELERAGVFRLATDTFSLKLVQSTLLHRWRDSNLLQCELLKTVEYEKLKTETKALINERFAQACIKKDAHSSAESSHHEDSMGDDDDEDEDSPYFDEAEDDDYLNDSDDPYNLH